MQCGNDGKEEGCPQKFHAGNPYPAGRMNFVEQNKKHSADLGKGVCFAKNAGLEVAQAGDREQDCARRQNRNIAAENQHCVLPWNFMQDRQHKKHRTQQKLVGNRIEILSEQRLLMKRASQQTVEAIAKAGNDEVNQSPQITAIDKVNHDERNQNHPQQRQLIRSRKNLREPHTGSFVDCGWETSWGSLPAVFGVGARAMEGSSPVFVRNRWERGGSPPSGRSSSTRSIRCMGKKTTAGVNGSPSLTITVRSSNDASAAPLKLRPSGASARIIPQNFSRGLLRVAITRAPGKKGP